MKAMPVIPAILFASVLLCCAAAVTESAVDNPRETPVVKVVRENAAAVVNISTEHIILLRENPAWGSRTLSPPESSAAKGYPPARRGK